MNGEEYPEKPSGFLLGRGFILVLVVVFSSLSFTLGYFVGNTTGRPSPARPVQADSTPGLQPMKQNLQVPQTPALPAIPAPAQQDAQTAAKEAPPADTVAQTAAQQPPQGPSQKQQDQSKAPAAATVTVPAARKDAQPLAEEAETPYSVQIGAFRSPAEARRLKASFEKKGYKTSISTETDQKGQKIYKVKTGEFMKKKDAEALALKLKKTERLEPYVTALTE